MQNRIKAVRKALKLNQEEFGERIGVKQSTITAYECGYRVPLDVTASAICRVFNVNEAWLRTGEGEMFNPPERGEQIGRIAREAATTNPEEAAAFFKDLLGRFSDEEIVLLYTIVKDKFGK